jgi:hypothetical protein
MLSVLVEAHVNKLETSGTNAGHRCRIHSPGEAIQCDGKARCATEGGIFPTDAFIIPTRSKLRHVTLRRSFGTANAGQLAEFPKRRGREPSGAVFNADV